MQLLLHSIFSSQKNNCWVIQVKSFSAARNVASPAPKLVISKYTSGPFGKKSFNCDQCNYLTTQAAHLSQHMRKHTGEKLLTNATILAYKLVISKITSRPIQEKSRLSVMNVIIEAVKLQGWKYTSDSTLEKNRSNAEASKVKVHKRKHTGEKPPKCDQCSYCSNEASKVELHIQKQTGDKPFKCDQCNYSSKELVGWKCTSESTRESSRSSVISATFHATPAAV